MIHFEPKTHTYTTDGGEEYTSVTTYLGELFPFDQEEIAEKVITYSGSKYHGMTKERVLKLWDDSADHGNLVHNAIEDYIKYKKEPKRKVLIPLVNQFKKLKFSGPLLSEELVWDDEYKLAGTADILEDCGKYFYLWDIKTSNKISDDKLMKFSLQLELYKRLIQKTFNKPVKIGGILWFEDFVVKAEHTKLKVFQTLKLEGVVDDMLKDRLKEIK